MLVRAGDVFPFDHYVASTETIPSIDPRQDWNYEEGIIDVTSAFSGNHRETIPGMGRLMDSEGQTIMIGGMEVINAALSGGGQYHWIYPNGNITVQTLEEYEDELMREAEMDELDYADY